MCSGTRSVGRRTIPSGNRPSSSIRGWYARGYDGAVPTKPLQTLLERAFPDATEVRVEDRTGGGDHFQVTVASPRFKDLPLIEQHRLVNEALAEPLRDGTIHELRIKTRGT